MCDMYKSSLSHIHDPVFLSQDRNFFKCDVSLVARGNGFWHLLKIRLVKTCNMLNQNLQMLADSKCEWQQALYSLLLSHKTVCAVNSNMVHVD